MEKNGEKSRDRIIIRTSVIGIIANIFLAAFKAVIGLLSHSVAVIMDAVNNLSDALSSVITIIGTKLSKKAPDKKHPLGYGRIEYLSAAIISVIVLYAGVTSLVESVKSILHPETPDYSAIALIIIGAAVVVKVLLGTFVRGTGKKVNSDALTASGSDALFDSVISASTLVAAGIYLIFGISLEAWLGAVISLFIIKSGLEMLRDTISEILGERVDAALAKAVRETITSFPEVGGAYDLIIHNYGPEQLVGSVHVELPDVMTIEEADALERAITAKVFQENGVIMTGISVYAKNTGENEASAMETQIRSYLAGYPQVLQMHGFYIRDHQVNFDLIIDFDVKNRNDLYREIQEHIKAMYPEYQFVITQDSDIADL